jgi:hypothetical protein
MSRRMRSRIPACQRRKTWRSWVVEKNQKKREHVD